MIEISSDKVSVILLGTRQFEQQQPNTTSKTDVRKIRESKGDFYIMECADEMNPGYLHVRLCCGNRSDLNLQQFDFETLLYSKYIAAG